MESNELQIFNQTVIQPENDCIFIQFLCDFFEINSENQRRIIQNDAVLSSQSTKKSSYLLFGDNRQRYALTKKGFIRWIQLINANTVKPELREKLAEYQTMIFDYLYGETLVPNIKRQYEIDVRMKELNRNINKLMVEHKQLEIEKKQLTKKNYIQLGLSFPDENENIEQLEQFHQKLIAQ